MLWVTKNKKKIKKNTFIINHFVFVCFKLLYFFIIFFCFKSGQTHASQWSASSFSPRYFFIQKQIENEKKFYFYFIFTKCIKTNKEEKKKRKEKRWVDECS